MPPVIDSVLVRQSQAGDLAAFRTLVVRHARAVEAIVAASITDPARREDQVVGTFRRLHRALFTLRDVTWFPLFAVRQARSDLEATEHQAVPATGAPTLIAALWRLSVPQREVALLAAALSEPAIPVLMEYTGLAAAAIQGRLDRASVVLRDVCTTDAWYRPVAQACLSDANLAARVADRVIAEIESDPRQRRRPGLLGRLPPVPAPLAVLLALAIAALVLALVLRALPGPLSAR